MSPHSMLNTPVELLRNAPAEGEPVARAERVERRAAHRVTLAILLLAAAAAILAAALH